jgi:hypothetical protein
MAVNENWLKDLERRCQEHCDSAKSPLSETLASVRVVPAVIPNVVDAAPPIVPPIPHQPMGLRVYLAGRISKNDWRNQLVYDNRPDDDTENWRKTKSLPMQDGNTCVGPFFIGCDHGCAEVFAKALFEKAVAGIKACNLFYMWCGTDFEAFGVEIGVARTLNKRVVIARHNKIDIQEQLFAAGEVITADDPITGYLKAVSMLRGEVSKQ